jgi:2-methylcitrate dehydratase
MTLAEELGAFAARIEPEDLGPPVREALAGHLLDSLGWAIAALGEPDAARLRAHLEAAGGSGATPIGGGRLSAEDAALFDAALIAALDRHDAYLAPDDVVHPSETLGAVLAAAERAGADGAALLAGMAVAYELEVRLATEAPVRAHGLDRSTHLAVAAAGGAARALGLDAVAAAHALAIAAVRAPVLGVARDGARSDLASLAGPLAVRDGLAAALLARGGFTGPLDAFEGRRGTFEVFAGPFRPGDLTGAAVDAATRVAIRFHPGDLRAQAAIEAALDVAGHPDFVAAAVTRVEVAVPPLHARLLDGSSGDPARDLPALIAAALAGPEERARIRARVELRADPTLARRLPAHGPAVVRVRRGGTVLEAARLDADGSPARPAPFDRIEARFERLAARGASPALRRALVAAVRVLPGGSAADLAGLLAAVR